MCRNKNVLAGVVYLILRKKFTFALSVLTTPAGKGLRLTAMRLGRGRLYRVKLPLNKFGLTLMILI
jgi:hypothetical protein